MIPLPILSFLGSKLGGYAVAGLIAAVLGGMLYVQGLRLDSAKANLRAATTERDEALRANARFEAKIKEITEDAEAQAARANKAARDLAAAKARNETQIANILRDIQNAASTADAAPLSPAERAALIGLRSAYPDR